MRTVIITCLAAGGLLGVVWNVLDTTLFTAAVFLYGWEEALKRVAQGTITMSQYLGPIQLGLAYLIWKG